MKLYKFSENNLQRGQISKILLILAALVLVVAIVAYLIIVANNKPKPINEETKNTENTETGLPELVFEKQLGDINFIFQSARDFGPILSSFNIVNPKYVNQEFSPKSIKTTTGRFVQVTVGAVNMGKYDTGGLTWDLLNIVDSEGRNFIPSKGYQFDPWTPQGSACGAALKPAFDPVFCTKIYEVSDESEGLKITIQNKKAAASKTAASKALTDVLDIVLK